MNIKKIIGDALGLHASMARGGEQPSETSERMLKEAYEALRSLDSMALEAMQAVDVINGDLDAHYHTLGYYDDRDKADQVPTPYLVFDYSGTACGVMFGEWPLWSSENEGVMYDDDDNQLPLEPYLRKQIAARLKVLREMPF